MADSRAGCCGSGNRFRQHETDSDQPDKAREPCQGDEEQCAWGDQVEPTELAHSRKNEAKDHESPAITQQALSATLGMVPSRLVTLLDELEVLGLTERRANPGDRRSYALHLTEKGRSTLGMIGRISREHQQDVLQALSEDERKQLTDFLQRIADAQGLTRGVHPGYAKVRGSGARET